MAPVTFAPAGATTPSAEFLSLPLYHAVFYLKYLFFLLVSGQNRLNVLVKSLLLRRTKSQTCSKGKPLVG